jgi:hypothetical protein
MTTSQVETGEDIGALDTIRRGMAFSPELTEGIRVTLLLAVLASVGQIIVPIAVQQTLDRGLNAEGGADVGFTVTMGLVAGFAILVTSFASSRPPNEGWPRCASRRSATCTTCRCSPRTPSAGAPWSPG